MALTIIGPEALTIRTGGTALIERKRLWTDAYEVDMELRLEACSVEAAGSGMGSCTLLRRYGARVLEYEADYPASAVAPVYLIDHWVRVKFHTAAGSEVVFTGRIAAETREVFGDGDAAAGKQLFTAYDASHLLAKIDVTDSLWLREKRADEAADTSLPVDLQATHVQQRIGWMPTANARGAQHWMVGNRFSHIDGDNNERSWFGGTLIWNMRQLVEHLLARYAEAAPEGPSWYLGGQLNFLESIERSVPFSPREELLSILRRIIHPSYGLDFKVEPVGDSGFMVVVFALTDEEFAVGGVPFPSNPDAVTISSAARDVEVIRVVASAEHAVGRIRVLGRRMVCACTLRAFDGSAVRKWKESLEEPYIAGTGVILDDAELHDKARQATRFEGVYQAFGAPDPWNRAEFQTNPMQQLVNGAVVLEQASSAAPVYQDKVRSTLPWVPFQGDRDTPDAAGGAFESEMMAPQAWALDPQEQRYVAADQVGMSVAALQNEWGLRLQCTPNHLLALNHFPVDAISATEPKYDYEELVITFAFETDHRLGEGALEFERVGGVRPHDGTTDIIDEDAELWFASPGTVYGIDHEGKLLETDRGTFMVLRNDSERMSAVLAGAIGRYFKTRMRAEIVLRGYFPYSLLIGKVLTVIEQSGDSRSIHGAITAVEYQGGENPRTVIRAGYAR